MRVGYIPVSTVDQNTVRQLDGTAAAGRTLRDPPDVVGGAHRGRPAPLGELGKPPVRAASLLPTPIV